MPAIPRLRPPRGRPAPARSGQSRRPSRRRCPAPRSVRKKSFALPAPGVMAAFVDAHDTDAAVAARAQPRDRSIARKKMDDAVEPKRLGKHHIDGKPVGEDRDPRGWIAVARDLGKS